MAKRMNLHTTSIYVNAASRRLDAANNEDGISAELHEKKRWVRGEQLLAEARRVGAELPLIFAHYEDLTFWALARSITLDNKGTTYTFSNLRPLSGHQRENLVLAGSHKQLPNSLIRSYALVDTPQFLHDDLSAAESSIESRQTGAELAKRWGVDVLHALYNKSGTWYHRLKRFPGALFDAHGYVTFDTELDFLTCPQLRIRKDVEARHGISPISGYVKVSGRRGPETQRDRTTTIRDDELSARETSVTDVDLVEQVIRPGQGRAGQAWSASAAHRKAVELRAMDLALAHYALLWPEVHDVSPSSPFDILCRDGKRELRVEVKGTTSRGNVVLMTRNEVSHARQNPGIVALFLVAGVRVQPDGTAIGGTVEIFEPWEIGECELAPLAFECHLRRAT